MSLVPTMMQKIDGNEYRSHKINQRISSLVSDSTVRQGIDYMDAAQIAMQVSWLDRRHSTIDDETGLNSVVVQMMEQFKALTNSDQLVSLPRMIEVVATIFKYDSDLLNNHRVVKTLNSFIATIFNKKRYVQSLSNQALPAQSTSSLLDLMVLVQQYRYPLGQGAGDIKNNDIVFDQNGTMYTVVSADLDNFQGIVVKSGGTEMTFVQDGNALTHNGLELCSLMNGSNFFEGRVMQSLNRVVGIDRCKQFWIVMKTSIELVIHLLLR